MARRDPVKEAIEELARHAVAPRAPEAMAFLRKTLAKADGLVVARVARVLRENAVVELLPEMAAAFMRLLRDPERDKQCQAKLKLCAALDELGFDEVEPFWAGLHHVQLEPVWGGTVDAAAALRPSCAGALVRLEHPGVRRALADMLFDAWTEARVGAARAIAYAGGPEAELVLRMKLHAGDAEIAVTGECMSGLMTVAAEDNVALLDRHVRGPALELAEQAALALGGSHHPAALAALERAWEDGDDARRHALVLAFAVQRSRGSFERLLGVLATGREPLAAAALQALLSVMREDEARMTEIRATLERRGSATLLAALAEAT